MKIVPNILLILLVLLGVSAFAGPTGPPPPEVPPPGLPIDGDLILLLVSAVVYGIFKINKIQLNKKTPM